MIIMIFEVMTTDTNNVTVVLESPAQRRFKSVQHRADKVIVLIKYYSDYVPLLY